MNINVNANAAKELIVSLHKKMDEPKIMDALAEEAIRIIRDRTRQGIDVNGNAFKAYSKKPCYFSTNPKYNADRKAPVGGRITKSKKSMYFSGGYAQYQGHKPTLTNLGLMIDSMIYRRNGNTRIIYFADAGNRSLPNGALAKVHNEGLGKAKKREFFNIKQSAELDRLKAVWERLVNNAI